VRPSSEVDGPYKSSSGWFISPAQDPFTEEPAVGVTSEAPVPHAFDYLDEALLIVSIQVIEHRVSLRDSALIR
jgi:hypothetical protein